MRVGEPLDLCQCFAPARDSLEAERIGGVLHDTVLDEVRVGVVETGAHEPVSALDDPRAFAEVALDVGRSHDADDLLSRHDDRTFYKVVRLGREDAGAFDNQICCCSHRFPPTVSVPFAGNRRANRDLSCKRIFRHLASDLLARGEEPEARDEPDHYQNDAEHGPYGD